MTHTHILPAMFSHQEEKCYFTCPMCKASEIYHGCNFCPKCGLSVYVSDVDSEFWVMHEECDSWHEMAEDRRCGTAFNIEEVKAIKHCPSCDQDVSPQEIYTEWMRERNVKIPATPPFSVNLPPIYPELLDDKK